MKLANLLLAAASLSAACGGRDPRGVDTSAASADSVAPGDSAGASATAETNCGTDPVLQPGQGVGDVRLGEPLSALRARCALRDSTYVVLGDWSGEVRQADTVHVWLAMVNGRRVRIGTSDGIVDAITVSSPVFHTADSVRVGTNVTYFRDRPSARFLQPDHLPIRYPVWLEDRCGITFYLSAFLQPAPQTVEEIYTVADVRDWPDSIRVMEIMLSPCQPDEP